jgi:hypothetical protein
VKWIAIPAIYTEKLFWNSEQEELTTDQPVKIIYPNGEIIRGTGMKSNGSLSRIVIYHPVGIHPPEKEEKNEPTE